jgi:CheY-like chemotaxis protein
LSRSKDQFLATLSHELRTPLNAIYGWARMLDAGRLDEAAIRRATEAILRNAAAQVQLIEDLFDVSRVITGNMRLDVRLRRASAHIELEVRDTGEGIAPEHMSRIFQRFGQADSSSTRRYSGLGIGLALVRHLVDLHGGTVSVHSAGLGRGATFTVILPLAATPALPAPAASGSVRAPGPDQVKPVSLRDLRILVVDDDADGLELAALVLVNAGAEVRTASSAAAAMAVLEDWPADVLVTDLEMPGEDGVGLLRRARQMMTLRARRLPALALTAYGRSEDRVRALAAGFNLHLGKPVNPAELVLAVASLLGRTG